MRENDLRGRHKRRFKATTDSKHTLPVAPNLLGQNFEAESSQSGVGGGHHLWYAQPTKPARMGAELLEHVWNASLVGVDVAVTSMPYLCYERE